nr:dihydroanticapsin 7-dehydrogenase [Quercus suber]
MTYVSQIDLALGLEDTHVLVTGGFGLIGRHVVSAFLAAGSKVTVVDLPSAIAGPSPFSPDQAALLLCIVGDISDEASLHAAFTRAEAQHGPVACCVALAGLDLSVLAASEGGLCDMELAEWQRVMAVNVTGTFLTCRAWLRGIRSAVSAAAANAARLRNVGLIVVGSEAGTFGVRTHAAYAAGKSAVQVGLLRSMAQDAPRVFATARVNAVAPGAVDTTRFREECTRFGERWRYEESEATVGLRKAVPPEDVARQIVVLASERWSAMVHGQVLAVDGGKMGTVVWSPTETEEGTA